MSSTNPIARRKFLQTAAALTALAGTTFSEAFGCTSGAEQDRWKETIDKGLLWLASQQGRSGGWTHPMYSTAVSSLAGTALICSGSTTTQGPYAKGDPKRDNRYTYGHGFAMLFLSQVLGEEEDTDRRQELIEVLQNAVSFSVSAQTKKGGWGYVSAKEDDFDEGSTTITQVQGLRGCRNAGLVVPKEAIEKAKKYIYGCQNKEPRCTTPETTRVSTCPRCGTTHDEICTGCLIMSCLATGTMPICITPKWFIGKALSSGIRIVTRFATGSRRSSAPMAVGMKRM